MGAGTGEVAAAGDAAGTVDATVGGGGGIVDAEAVAVPGGGSGLTTCDCRRITSAE